jgi:LuxR family maltose regulon positive regulatory protein
VAEQAQRLQAMAEAPEAVQPMKGAGEVGGEELRALALISLGSAEFWAARFEEAGRHLEQGVALARRIGRPFLEFTGLAYLATVEVFRSYARAAERGTQAIELAERHGWTDEPAAGRAYSTLAAALAWQGRLDEAEAWLRRAERTVRAEAEPGTRMGVHHVRGVLELARGRLADARAAFEAAERLAGRLAGPHLLVTRARAMLLHTLVRLGETGLAEQVLAGLGEKERERGEIRTITAMLRLAGDDPQAAMAALIPVLDGSAPLVGPTGLIQACLLEAIARDALGDPAAAGCALERALDLTEAGGALLWFLLHPVPSLLERHARQRTAHGALLADVLSLLSGQRPALAAAPRPPLEALSDSEIRVLRYLPTNLPVPQIAGELYVSVHTVKTHTKHLYAKLGTHTRAEAVDRARALGLLAPSPHRGQVPPSR